MIELTLLGPHADSSQIVFTDPQGQRYLVTIDDALRAAVRRDALQAQSLPSADSPLRPRQIQELLRAGMTPSEIASAYDVEVAFVSKFRSPVDSEKRYIISQSLKSTVGAEADCPTLEDLVVDRLATVSVDPASLQWNATRKTHQPWELHVSFVQAARVRQASWEVTGRGSIVRALNDEARWLTETTAPAPSSFNSNVMTLTRVGEVESAPSVPRPADSDNITAFLDELAAARGKRPQLEDSEHPEGGADGAAVSNVQPFESLRAKVSAATSRHQAKGHGANGSAVNSPVEPGKGSPVFSAIARPADGGEDSPSRFGSAPTSASSAGSDSDVQPSTGGIGLSDLVDSAPPGLADGSDVVAVGASSAQDPEDTLPGLESLPRGESADSNSTATRRSNRRSVPSWAEIVFGSRTDS